ncbi:MAG: hypothetical protein IPO91_11600 [Chloroflexi bacterium]|nr:hypothetical protein [Chloroflexota bacterium]
MNYLHLLSLDNIALLKDWLEETGELYVDIDLPHSGSSGSAYLVRSMNELKLLISRQTHPEIVIAIFHSLQYPIRGIADEILLKQVFGADFRWCVVHHHLIGKCLSSFGRLARKWQES